MSTMSEEVKDDPCQVLAILNSLGIVNITAQELKLFLKELKLYRKAMDKNMQRRKENITVNIQDQDYLKDNVQHTLCKSKESSITTEDKQIIKQVKLEQTQQVISSVSSETSLKKVPILKENSKYSKKAVSAIKSKNVESKVKKVPWNRRGANDPVALYNHYKNIWSQMPIPGEKTNAKLRCGRAK